MLSVNNYILKNRSALRFAHVLLKEANEKSMQTEMLKLLKNTNKRIIL